MIKTFKQSLEDLKEAVHSRTNILSKESQQDSSRKKEYVQAKLQYIDGRISNLLDKIQRQAHELSANSVRNNSDNSKILRILELTKVREKIKDNADSILSLVSQLPQSEGTRNTDSISVPKNLPIDIRSEILADISEVEKSFNSGCYRASTILCGRIIEVALHRKYYEKVGIDLLEKNPGIGLGKLIAKMVEKEIKLDPGLTQQIHLINQVRVYSVHKKSESFYPSKSQAHAMILYTMDVLNKLF